MNAEWTIKQWVAHGREWVEAGWEWAPGQVAVTWVEGVDVAPIVGVVTSVVDGHPCGFKHIGDDGFVRLTNIVPYLADDGTLGHALGQVRRAWGDRFIVTDGDEQGWSVDNRKCRRLSNDELHATEHEALLAARWAAP